MKVRYFFELVDFEGRGQMIVRNSSPPGTDDIGFMSSVAYKVGFEAGTKKPTLVSLADGLTFIYDNDQALVDKLNNDEFGYRPMTLAECRAVAGNVGARFPDSVTEGLSTDE